MNLSLDYWKLHRELYIQTLDSYDNDIRQTIMENPEGDEAIRLNERVDREVKEKLGELAYA